MRLDLVTLGRVDLRGSGPRDYSQILRRPKRMAVLVYLAAAKRDGLCRRDSLVSTFWPELDDTHARASLRQVLHGLRQELGGDVLVVRGHDAVGLSNKHLWCDAHAFRGALAAGDLERAVNLYQGPFLEGFFLSNTPEFDHWVESTRRSLEHQYTMALETLAQRAAARGDRQQAIWWWQQLADHDSCNSRIALQLIGALRDSGDHIAALDRAEQHVADIRKELGVEPDRAMQSVVDELRGAATGAPQVRVASRAPVRREKPPAFPSRWASLAALALIALTALVSSHSPPPATRVPPADQDPGIIAVFPFTVQDGARDFPFDPAGFAFLLSESLDGIPGWNSRSLRVLDPIDENQYGAPTPTEAVELAGRIGAARFVIGGLVSTTTGTKIHAALRDLDGNECATAHGNLSKADDVFPLADHLTRQLMPDLIDLRGPLDSIALASTTSLTALNAYLEGTRQYRSGNLGAAVTAFQDAVRHDSAFAVAWLRLAMVAAHPLRYREEIVRSATERAASLRHSLPAAGGAFMQAIAAVLGGDTELGIRLLGAVIERESANAEVWLWMGIAHLQLCRESGECPDVGRTWLEQSFALDPDNAVTPLYLAWLSMLDGDVPAAESFIGETFRSRPAALPLRVWSKVANGRAAPLSELANAGDFSVLAAALLVANYTEDLKEARAIAQLLTTPARPAGMKTLGHILSAYIDFTTHGWAAAKGEMELAERQQPTLAMLYSALLAVSPFAVTPADDLRALQNRLREVAGPDDGPGEFALFATDLGMFEVERYYLLGRIGLELNDGSDALRYAVKLERIDRTSAAWPLASDLALELRARVDRKRGVAEQVLALLTPTHKQPPWRVMFEYRSALFEGGLVAGSRSISRGTGVVWDVWLAFER